MAFIGNSPTQGVITGGNIVDGSIESIDLATLTNIDINSGSIDGTVIGAASAAAITATTLNATGAATFSGDVGIGGAATDATFHVKGTGIDIGIPNALIDASFADASNSTGLVIGHRTDETTAVLAPRTATGNLAFHNYNGGWSESMRITNTGNLLVGKTANDNTTAGHRFTASGFASHVVANDYPLLLNRLSSDGALLTLRKDGTTVGSIGTKTSMLTIGSDDVGLYFDSGNNRIIPFNTTTQVNNDAVADIGAAAYRFKDLYLSGTVNAGAATFSSTVSATQLTSTSSSPSLPAFAVSSGNGLYNSGTNQVAISTGGVNRLTLDASGKLGIGVSAPNEKLESSGAIRVLGTTATSRNSGTLSFNGTLFNIESRGPDVSNRGTIGFYQATSNGSSAIQSMLLDASGNLLVGGTDAAYEGTKLITGSYSSTAAGLSILTSSSGAGYLLFGDGTGANGYVGQINYNHSLNRMAFNTNSVERMAIDASGSLYLGVTTPNFSADSLVIYQPDNYALYSGSNGTGGSNHMVFGNANGWVGSITTNGSATQYLTSSDYRLKKDDVPMTGATERVKALRPINFAWKLDGSRTDGFFAHEAQEVVPECSTGSKDAMRDEEYEVTPAVEEVKDEDGNVTTEAIPAVMGTRSVPDYQGIDQSKLVPLLTATIQELIARIEALEGA